MRRSTPLVLAASILLGLVLGLAIRRARMPAPVTSVDALAQLPSRERIHAALLRAEVRDLDSRLAALREEGDSVDREKTLLAALSQPPPPPPMESTLRINFRKALGEFNFVIGRKTIDWLIEDPHRFTAMMKIGAEIFREKDWGRNAYPRVQQYLMYFVGNMQDSQTKLLEDLRDAQRTERDPLVRGWMLGLLDANKVTLPPDALDALVRDFRECTDPRFRESAFGLILQAAPSNQDLVRGAIRDAADPEEKARNLLKAWGRRALPGGEVRAFAREVMASDDPSVMIMEAQDWVPKYINPFAPQDTIGLFNQTLSKPIDPVYKAVSLMVMGSIATLFPGHPGRAELEAFATSTDNPKLKEFASKVGALVDEGKSFDDIRRLNPVEFGLDPPK